MCPKIKHKVREGLKLLSSLNGKLIKELTGHETGVVVSIGVEKKKKLLARKRE